MRNIKAYPPQNWIARWYRHYCKATVQGTNNTICSYMGHNLSKSQLWCYRFKLRWAYVWHKWNSREYFQYGYERLSRSARKTYVTGLEKEIFCQKFNTPNSQRILNNKGLTYEHFAPYFHRDVCVVADWSRDIEKLTAFLARHRDFIVKSICEAMGNGVVILRNGTIDDVVPLFRSASDGLILEELIQQSAELAAIHPQSVNTVRIPTWVVNEEVHILPSFIRFGCGDSEVDNAAKGGVFGNIDLESGVVTGAYDEYGHSRTFHPDSNLSIVGLTIPQWNECVAMAKELSQVLPEAKYVSWDFALTDRGWVLVEGNARGQLVCQQISSRKGIRDFFLKIDPHCFDID